jgi:two-component system cell cycle sensor histidine kinase/response regulator CckA
MKFHSAVQESTRLLQHGLATAFEASAEALVITDEQGIVRFCNHAVEEITGYSRLEIIGKRLSILGPSLEGPADSEAILCTPVSTGRSPSGHSGAQEWRRQMWQTLRGQRPWTGEFACRKKDGTSYSVAVKLTPIPQTTAGHEEEIAEGVVPALHGLVASYRDVTVERRLQAQLSRSQSLEATGRMAAGISHDFSNVVSVVNGCSEWLLSRMDRDHPFHGRIGQIRQAGQRGAELIHQLLTLSKAKTGVSRAISVNQQIHQASSTFQHLAGVDIKFSLDLDPLPGMIGGDPTQFLQLMLNLISNARDAMPDGGTLTIKTGRATVSQARPCEGGPAPGSYVTVTVADNGTGMGDLTKSRAFDPFFTTKEFGEGTGLGLSFVADVMRNNGGYIEVETVVGGGTTFRLYFPSLAVAEQSALGVVAGAMSR